MTTAEAEHHSSAGPVERRPATGAPAGGSAASPPSASPAPSRGISFRASLILSLSLLVAATGLMISLISFRGARAGIEQMAHDMFREVSDHAVTRTRGFLQRAVPIAQTLGEFSHLGLAVDDDRDLLGRQLAAMLRANRGVSWISYSDEAGTFVGAYRTPADELRVNQSYINERGETPVVEYDVLPDGSWRLFRTEEDSGFDPRTRPYYLRAREAGRIVWPPPYIFYDQGVPGVTCANPLYDQQGRLRGVLTVDFDLDLLSQFAQQLSVSANSRLFIMAPDGTVLAHPEHRPAAPAARAREGQRGRGELLTVKTVGDPLVTAFDAALAPEDRHPGAGGNDHARQFEFRHEQVNYYARSTAFTIDGDLVWIVGVVAPQSDFLAGARHTSAISAAASGGAMLLAVAVAMLLARRVSGPILALVAFMDGVRSGNLTARARLGGAREFRQLSDALNRMLHDLRDRLRLRNDMTVAMHVQQGLLPATPPRVEGLDIFGFSAYCDETGGDYFDFLPLDRPDSPGQEDGGGGLLVAIADVVGHGIGSAILMAGARGVLHSAATSCGHLGQLMAHLNDQLVPAANSRFMTMLLWYIDPKRGTACWANAGHDPAIIYDPQTEEFSQSGRGGFPLGIERGARYEEQAFGPVRPGQVIVLGTDGVWETRDASGECYGKQRLMDVIRATADHSAEQIAAAVRHNLDLFRGQQHQRDDVTLVVMKVRSL